MVIVLTDDILRDTVNYVLIYQSVWTSTLDFSCNWNYPLGLKLYLGYKSGWIPIIDYNDFDGWYP